VKVISEGTRPSLFSPGWEVELEVRGVFRKLRLATLYGVAFQKTNLLGERSLEMMSSTAISVGARSLNASLSNELLFSDLRQDKSDRFLFCDDQNTHLKDGTDIWSEAAKCKQWAAVSLALLQLEASQLTGKDTSKIFIAPFAWSSLSTTIAVWMVCLILIYAKVIRTLIPRVFTSGIIAADKIPLTIAAVAFFGFGIIPIALISFCVEHL
jgi:hypothetical protein